MLGLGSVDKTHDEAKVGFTQPHLHRVVVSELRVHCHLADSQLYTECLSSIVLSAVFIALLRRTHGDKISAVGTSIAVAALQSTVGNTAASAASSS